jgi:hypothetical protein
MTTPIQIPAKLRARVEKVARAVDITAQALVVQAIEEHLNRFRSTGDYQIDKLSPMLQAARVRISQGGRTGVKHDPLVLAANTAHHTLRTLAEAVGCSQPSLTQARHGEISISLERAKQIESICGFKATCENWPRLRAEETKKKGRKNHGRKPTKETRPKKGAR